MKVGYWIVIGLIAAAVVAVLLATWSERDMPVEQEGDAWVVLAASDGTGHGLDDPGAHAWPALIAGSTLTSPRIVNLSIAGLTLDRAVSSVLPDAVQLHPRGAVVWLVVNDFGMGRPLASYISDLETVLTAFQRVGVAVIVGNLPDLSSLPFFAEASGDPAALRAECARWNEAIAEVAQRYGAAVVDFFPDPIDPATVGSDGFHPSEEGQRRLAERFREAMRDA